MLEPEKDSHLERELDSVLERMSPQQSVVEMEERWATEKERQKVQMGGTTDSN
jgi:hypothetical protein